MIEIPAGVATLGLRRSQETFGWDNEYEAHAVDVPAFAVDQYKVTNGQYLDFILAGGYETRSFWTDNDWNWKTATGSPIQCSGGRQATTGFTGRCSQKCRFRSTAGLCKPCGSGRVCTVGAKVAPH